MERRVCIIAAVAGGMGLAECATVNGWMNGIRRSTAPSVKDYERTAPAPR